MNPDTETELKNEESWQKNACTHMLEKAIITHV